MFTSLIFLFVVLCFGAGPSCAQNFKNYRSVLKEVHERYTRQIAPGTKWCGNGDKAKHYHDLGYFSITDACCREHDKCPSSIPGRQSRFGLTNPDRSARSHCDCDKKFYDCLTEASTKISRIISMIYFTFLRKKCFRELECPPGQICEETYEWVDGATYLSSPPELETWEWESEDFDYSENEFVR